MKLIEKIINVLNDTPKTGYEISTTIRDKYPSKIEFLHKWEFDRPSLGGLYYNLDKLLKENKIKREFINDRWRYTKI